jgi:ATP-dependent helicase HrpA
MPLAGFADDFLARANESHGFGAGSLVDVLLKAVRDKTQLDVKRADFKLEQVPPHLFMNFRVVDEHGRQLDMGRNLPALKSALGTQARSAFQALAVLKLAPAAEAAVPTAGKDRFAESSSGKRPATAPPSRDDTRPAPGAASPTYTDWGFGELPELMEVRKGSQTLVGFPALIDKGDHVQIEVFDEPELASAQHRAGLRRLVALQIRDALKYLEKNIPDLQRMSVLFMSLGTAEELRAQIIDLAIDRAFLADPLPTDAASFKRRIDEGRGRLTLIANEIARSAHQVLVDHAAATRKLKDVRGPRELSEDVQAHLARLVPKYFVTATPWAQLSHLPRYLKAITMRLDKWRADPARDSTRLAELRPIEQRYLRTLADRKGAADTRLDEFRWLLEELRVSLFAQELRTPQPVSVKRLEKVWAQLTA